MSLGWCTGVLLVSTFLGNAPAEGEGSVRPEAPIPSIQQANSEGPFDPAGLAASMDRAANRTAGPSSVRASLEGSEAPGLTKILGQLLFSLLLVVGLIYGLSYGLRRIAGRGLLSPSGPLRVLSKQSVSQKSSVYLVAAFDRFLIIGESPQGLRCLSEFTDPGENEALRRAWGWDRPGEAPPSFSSKVSSFAPVFHSHVSELEREIDQYREVAR